MLRKVVAKKDPSHYGLWEKALIDARDKQNDWTDKKYIEPIIACING